MRIVLLPRHMRATVYRAYMLSGRRLERRRHGEADAGKVEEEKAKQRRIEGTGRTRREGRKRNGRIKRGGGRAKWRAYLARLLHIEVDQVQASCPSLFFLYHLIELT